MKIVAFMQNPWFRLDTPKEAIDRYRTDQEFHRRLLGETMSGNRLRIAFGEHWFKEIWWDNANPKHSDVASGMMDPDIAHIERVIKEQEPNLIITFGAQAKKGVERSVAAISIKCMHCLHPNARFFSQSSLDKFANDVIQYATLTDVPVRDA